MTETELRPCPFCGKTPAYGIVRLGMIEYYRYTVQCVTCNFDVGWFEREEKAVKKWNTRAEVE